MNTVTLTRAEWNIVEECLRELSWNHGYAIGNIRSAIAEQLDEQEY